MSDIVYIPKKIGFFRPHKKVTQDNLELDPKSGELKPIPSMARQEFVAQCDINNILKQFKKTGIIQHISANANAGRYEDLPDPLDYQESLHIIMDAEASFASLPSKVRSRFENDPTKFLEFMSDPKNAEEMYELGLATRPAPPAEQSGPQAADSVSATKEPSEGS